MSTRASPLPETGKLLVCGQTTRSKQLVGWSVARKILNWAAGLPFSIAQIVPKQAAKPTTISKASIAKAARIALNDQAHRGAAQPGVRNLD
jgi:hypothetical protein